jgi:hypothetical protein
MGGRVICRRDLITPFAHDKAIFDDHTAERTALVIINTHLRQLDSATHKGHIVFAH